MAIMAKKKRDMPMMTQLAVVVFGMVSSSLDGSAVGEACGEDRSQCWRDYGVD